MECNREKADHKLFIKHLTKRRVTIFIMCIMDNIVTGNDNEEKESLGKS